MGKQEDAEALVALLDEWIEGREPQVEELERVREFLEREATTFPHRRRLL